MIAAAVGAARQPAQAKHRQGVGEGGGCDSQRREQRGDDDDPVLAEALAERPVEDLAQTVGDREAGHDDRGAARRDAEFVGDLRQQRIGPRAASRRKAKAAVLSRAIGRIDSGAATGAAGRGVSVISGGCTRAFLGAGSGAAARQ